MPSDNKLPVAPGDDGWYHGCPKTSEIHPALSPPLPTVHSRVLGFRLNKKSIFERVSYSSAIDQHRFLKRTVSLLGYRGATPAVDTKNRHRHTGHTGTRLDLVPPSLPRRVFSLGRTINLLLSSTKGI